MTQQEFSKIASTIPLQPGIYKYYNASNELLYVGKAKHLRKRVSSYFSKTFTNYKTAELVQRIHKIEFTIVNSEQDAFLLENSLIKEYQPLFNINLKDDKTYPYIVIKKESFPRIFLTRKKINDGSEYLGPFTGAGRVRELISFIKQYIPLRTCKLPLTEANIQKGKFKVCLEYHLGNCKGPCEGLQSLDDYNEGLQQIRNMLKGNLSSVINHFKKEMFLTNEIQLVNEIEDSIKLNHHWKFARFEAYILVIITLVTGLVLINVSVSKILQIDGLLGAGRLSLQLACGVPGVGESIGTFSLYDGLQWFLNLFVKAHNAIFINKVELFHIQCIPNDLTYFSKALGKLAESIYLAFIATFFSVPVAFVLSFLVT